MYQYADNRPNVRQQCTLGDIDAELRRLEPVIAQMG
jgi:hypothetical protein